jgi:P-type Ca2+ transporter type 2C
MPAQTARPGSDPVALQSMPGLSIQTARHLLSSVGPNEIALGGRRGLVQIVLETMREPMFLLLVVAAILYLALGDLAEGLFLLGAALVTICLVILQEARSERALAALRQLAQPSARVVREGDVVEIPARELVPGDVLLIGEGERVPADGMLISGEVLSVDESALTGESAPASKPPANPDVIAPGDDMPPGTVSTPFLYAGTLVVRGQGVVQVTRTGNQSALGKIGKSLADIEHEPTPLQKTAGRLVGCLGMFALAFCVVVAVSYGLILDDWVAGALSGLTIAVSLIPEEFPLVLAIFLAIGAWRLASQNVLTRRSAAIEALGGVSVLCVDKTGTLTENRMAVARVWTPQFDEVVTSAIPLRPLSIELLHIATLASAVRPVDPMDKAVHALRSALKIGDASPTGDPEQICPLRPDLLAVVQIWKSYGAQKIAAAKGAPEAIFRLCQLPADEVTRLQSVVGAYAAQGLRVLGVASARTNGPFGPDPLAVRFTFAGLVGFIDPLRPDVPAALDEARRAGIKVIMITGDHPATALAIARFAGLETDAGVLLGSEVATLSLNELRKRLTTVRVFARIAPEQKLRIVEALKKEGEVIAMTGDGINDGPALEAAHIGVAMGKRGTDVAREAADLVLLDDSFTSIVHGVRLGRRIFANLRRALTYVSAVHIPIAGMALLPLLVGLPPMLMPMHVVLLELIIDPTCSLVFESEPLDDNAMMRPPRPPGEAPFGVRQCGLAMVQGVVVLMGTLGLYWWVLTAGGTSHPIARGVALVVLVVGNLVLALTDSAGTGRIFAPHRRIYWAIVIVMAIVLIAVFNVPLLASIFDVSPPDLGLAAIAVVVGLVTGAWTRVIAFAKCKTSW